jgi:hypothetical protein
VAIDGSTSGMITTVIETKLSQIEEAALRLNGTCVDLRALNAELVAALEALMQVDYAEECQECGIGHTPEWKTAKAIVAKAKE